MLSAMSDRVSISIDNGIADVRLNRPDKLNALDQAMFQGIVEAGEGLKGDPGVRVVVLSGEGRGFCAGLDFGSFQAMAGSEAPARAAGAAGRVGLGAIGDTGGRITHLGQQAAWVWQELEVPVIAAVHGAALGGGLQIALGRRPPHRGPRRQAVRARGAVGSHPGHDRHRDAAPARRPRRGQGAHVHRPDGVGRGGRGARAGHAASPTTPARPRSSWRADLATKSPDALREGKRLLNLSGTRPLAEQLHDERVTMGSLIGSPNQVEATMAYFEKRPPAFT